MASFADSYHTKASPDDPYSPGAQRRRIAYLNKLLKQQKAFLRKKGLEWRGHDLQPRIDAMVKAIAKYAPTIRRNPAPKPKRGRPKNTPERMRKKALKAKLDELYNSPTIRFRSLEKAKARLLNRNPSPKWRIAGVTDGGGVYWFTGTKFTTEIRQAKAFTSRTAAKAEAVSLKQQLPNQIAYLRIQ